MISRNKLAVTGAAHKYAARVPDSAYTLDMDLHTMTLWLRAAKGSSDSPSPAYST